MKSLLMFLVFSVTLYAQDDYEDKPTLQDQLQFVSYNKGIGAEVFKKCVEERPNLCQIMVTGHHMHSIPPLRVPLAHLTDLNLSDGTLEGSDIVPSILNLAPYLSRCILTNNKISALKGSGINSDLPTHNSLTTLDCSGNLIGEADLTELRSKLPNLKQLNLSRCPLDQFNTEGTKVSSVITTVNLQNTDLSDAAQKAILQNARQVCLINTNSEEVHWFTLSASTLTAAYVFSSSYGIALWGASGLISPSGLAVVALLDAAGCAILGPTSALFALLACKKPGDRFQTVYIPQMDNITNYSEEDVMTPYAK
jgi:uncharacterized protein YjbI with pentapeptide repeats